MEFTINLIEENDYEKFCKWWKFWRWKPIEKVLLPNNGLGGLKITDENGVDVCVGFLYETNSGIAWIEFIISNPEIKDTEIRSLLTDLQVTVDLEVDGCKQSINEILKYIINE